MANIEIEWNKKALQDLANQVVADAVRNPEGLKCVKCGTELQRQDNRTLCPNCGLEYRAKA